MVILGIIKRGEKHCTNPCGAIFFGGEHGR